MSKAFAKVLGIPAVIITMEEYYAIVKKMRQGPEELTRIVKDEPEEDITDISASLMPLLPMRTNQRTRKQQLRRLKPRRSKMPLVRRKPPIYTCFHQEAQDRGHA